jgi:ATP-dependent RNA helicase DDX10/DBP4
MGSNKKPPRKYHQKRDRRSKLEDVEIQEINKILEEQAPPRGSNPLAMTKNSERPTFAASRKFEDFPLSSATKGALKEAKFVSLTAIQRAALPHGLCGRDVLGAAKTGSGKTLAFIIPLIEKLFREKWGRLDGLGALVISPTRELALQIFEELRKVGKRHELSAGVLIGGKDVAEEASRVAGLNILVATPGRLLQHMDETPGFDASSLQVLVLDEADRILDMGFSATLNAIVENLPVKRQTMLFSATQTKSVGALARLSLKDPEYVSVHADAEAPTPVRLEQAYMECPLPDKLDILWSFIRTHLRSRVIIFLSTCKQVRFVYEAFRRLRPGVPLRALHGRMSQYKRMGVYQQFCDSKAGVLFATDIAARGLDFPNVDWVVQADCPEDVAAYIHRVGRTARYTSKGQGLILLLPSEKEGMVAALNEAKIPIKGLRHNPAKLQAVTPALQALLSKDTELKEVAQKALVSYLRSAFLQPNRAVFDVTKLPVAEYALSMGLPTVPKLRFLKRGSAAANAAKAKKEQGVLPSRGDAAAKLAAQLKEVNKDDGDENEEEEESESEEEEEEEDNNDIEEESSGDELLVVKKRHAPEDNEKVDNSDDEDAAAAALSASLGTLASKKKKKMKIDPRKSSGTRVVFDEEGQAVDPLSLLGSKEGELAQPDVHGVFASVAERAAAAQAVMARRDKEDKEVLRELRKEKRDAKRARRLEREGYGGAGAVAMLGGGGGSSGDEDEEDGAGGYRGSDSDDEDDYKRGGGDSESDIDMDLLDSDSEGEDERKKTSHSGAGAEVAHLGMLPPSTAAVDNDGDANGSDKMASKKKKGKKNENGVGGMSLAEQEALALKLLRQRK